ncbi:pentatricopeptide repeat-containing protein at2g17033 [Phtheirospermum japonicum]|uniref:Pentatricopeptide repeat-containing protein at2g17033 n=1 Tax=Phtheirospermum japonicum TaxID=374723 RepID=A0A830BVV2_9LAMI|nr:pentatricopeptide repeat-containing protein at2g17033 [Phtheirospermum japonicum]
MIGGHGLQLSPPPVSAGFCRYLPIVCGLTKQGHRFLSAVSATGEPSAAIGLLRKFVAASSKHVTLTTLTHLLSPSTSDPRLSFLAFPLFSMIQQESWFQWNAKLLADLIALLHKQEMFDEAEILFTETVLKLGFKERDLGMFYCNLVDSHAKHKSGRGVFDSCTQLRQLILLSSSVYVKQRGYESMVAGFCEIGLPDEAENLIEEMRENGLKPSVYELKSIVYGYGQKGFFEDMKRIVVQMENEGFELDTVCCNMVLSSFGAHNELLDMLIWLRKMRKLGIPFSVRTYNSVLNSCPTIISLLEDTKILPLSIDELADNLKTGDEANLVMELLKSNVLDQVMEWKTSELKLDLHGMHLSTAYLILLQWFEELKQRFDTGSETTPTEVLVVCGCGKHSSRRGESPVKSLAKEMVMRMRCPLRIDRKNIGCFIGKGKVFREWLCNEDVNKKLSEWPKLV